MTGGRAVLLCSWQHPAHQVPVVGQRRPQTAHNTASHAGKPRPDEHSPSLSLRGKEGFAPPGETALVIDASKGLYKQWHLLAHPERAAPEHCTRSYVPMVAQVTRQEDDPARRRRSPIEHCGGPVAPD